MLTHPVCLLLEVCSKLCYGDIYLLAGKCMSTGLAVVHQNFTLLRYILIQICTGYEKLLHLLCDLHSLFARCLKCCKQSCDMIHIVCVHRCKCHTLAALCSHIKCIIPVCTTQADLVVISNIIERRQILDQQMLQQSSGIYITCCILLLFAL